MTVTTHALVGLLVAPPLAVLVPEHATTTLAAGVVGGIAPDLDVLATHRKLDDGDRVSLYKYPEDSCTRNCIHDGENPAAIVGSANLTQVAFEQNLELSAYVEGEGEERARMETTSASSRSETGSPTCSRSVTRSGDVLSSNRS